MLVLLTDGHDRGSRTSLKQAIAAAQKANVVVYAIAVGASADVKPLTALAAATGGRRFNAADAAGLGAAYDSVGRELDRTWQLSYFSAAREGDVTPLRVRAAGAASATSLEIPGGDRSGGPMPRSVAREPPHRGRCRPSVALLFAVAGVAGRRRRRSTEITRLLEPHLKQRELAEERHDSVDRFESLLGRPSGHSTIFQVRSASPRVERFGLKLPRGLAPLYGDRSELRSSAPSARSSAHLPRSPALLHARRLASPFIGLSIAPAPHEGLRTQLRTSSRRSPDAARRTWFPNGAGDRRRRRLSIL